MVQKCLKNLVLFPRSLGNYSKYLPTAPGPYVSEGAQAALLQLSHENPNLRVYSKHDLKNGEIIPFNPHTVDPLWAIFIDRNVVGKRDFERLVSLGHIAAFRMYDEKQLLLPSYFCDQ